MLYTTSIYNCVQPFWSTINQLPILILMSSAHIIFVQRKKGKKSERFFCVWHVQFIAIIDSKLYQRDKISFSMNCSIVFRKCILKKCICHRNITWYKVWKNDNLLKNQPTLLFRLKNASSAKNNRFFIWLISWAIFCVNLLITFEALNLLLIRYTSWECQQ